MNMDDQDWRQLLTTAAEREPGDPPEVDGDVARGRAALRARRLAVYGGGGLAVATILVSGVVIGQLSAGGTAGTSMPPETSIPAAAGETAGATPPSTTPLPEETHDNVRDTEPGVGGTKEFRFGLYDIAADHLDPEKTYLNYATRSLQSSGGSDGTQALGIKLGWKVPGEPGEGLVQIGVSNMTGPDDMFGCGALVTERCRMVELPGGGTVEVGERDDGSYSVLHRRPDGESVQVVVNPLFGNNALVPVEEMRIDRRDVFRLAQDERITLPDG